MTKARDIASAAPAPSTVSATELGYLDGVSSAIQTQIDGKQAANANVSTTELGYLDGVTSAIQTQLDAKIPKTLTTTTGDIIYASSANTPARLGIGSTSQVLTVSGGVPTWATPASGSTFVGAAAYKDANQSISTGAYTLITFPAENFDTNSYHSTSTNTGRMTIPSGKGGKYLLTSLLTFQLASDTGLRGCAFYKNGSALVYTANAKSVGDDTRLNASYVADLAVGDYIEVYAFQNSGVSMNVLGTNDQSLFSAVYLGA